MCIVQRKIPILLLLWETGSTSVCQPNIVQLIPFAEFSEDFRLSQQLLEDERQGEGGRRGIARCPVQEQGQDGGRDEEKEERGDLETNIVCVLFI